MRFSRQKSDDAHQRAGEASRRARPAARSSTCARASGSSAMRNSGPARRRAARGLEPSALAVATRRGTPSVGHRAQARAVGRGNSTAVLYSIEFSCAPARSSSCSRSGSAVPLRQQRQALELVLEDLEVVAQREGAVLGEELVLGRQLAPHGARRLIDGRPAGQADGHDQQRRQHQRELGPESQTRNATIAGEVLHTLLPSETTP